MTGVQTCALPICFPVTIEGSDDWLDDFESLFLNLSSNLGKECDWWNELGVSEIELDVIKYL